MSWDASYQWPKNQVFCPPPPSQKKSRVWATNEDDKTMMSQIENVYGVTTNVVCFFGFITKIHNFSAY